MVNDGDMWGDIEELEKNKNPKYRELVQDLFECFNVKYINSDHYKAEELKQMFKYKWGYWNDYY